MSEVNGNSIPGADAKMDSKESAHARKAVCGEARPNAGPLSNGPYSTQKMGPDSKETDLELYKIIISLWDSEISRFYNRQNLYIGIQIAAFAGLMAGFKGLLEFPGFIRLALLFLFFVGIITALIATRGLTTQTLTIKVIQDLENRNDGLDLIALGRKHTRVYILTNFVLSVALAWIMGLLWFAVWVYLELLYLWR